jgi:hypothetical protein
VFVAVCVSLEWGRYGFCVLTSAHVLSPYLGSPLDLPIPEEEPTLSSHCCQGNHFMSVHMVGTCVCPAPHVSACPAPTAPVTVGWGNRRCGVSRGGGGASGDRLMVADWVGVVGVGSGQLGCARRTVPPGQPGTHVRVCMCTPKKFLCGPVDG